MQGISRHFLGGRKWINNQRKSNSVWYNLLHWNINTLAIIWRENMLGYLSADIICSEKRTVFREHSSRKTVSFEEQIMSKDKYPSIFSSQMEAIVFIVLQIFYATHAVLKIEGYSRISPSFSWGIFSHVTCLDQSRVSEKIWWIIIEVIFCALRLPKVIDHLADKYICQHSGMKTTTMTPSFYYVTKISLSCNNSIPSFIGNLWRVFY